MLPQIVCLSCGYQRTWPTMLEALAYGQRHHAEPGRHGLEVVQRHVHCGPQVRPGRVAAPEVITIYSATGGISGSSAARFFLCLARARLPNQRT